MDTKRPSPEEMLARAAEEEKRARHGRLKIFFGMAPGVGKTYTMLESARARRTEGLDVVVGWVNTHGRPETEALTVGLEHIPPRVVDYRGIRLEEFDLDAALARRPALVLVDELAHTNAAGSRHAHRWQDVDELLDAGIDVHTTLNVQHVESLNDVVAIVTGVAVMETVPDSIIDRAHEIELVDLSPDDLLQRLREGKVYVPEQAESAAENFFRKRNLIVLRELALRRTAERVNLEAVARKRGERVERAWPTRELVLVAVGPAPQSAKVVRAAFRLATRLRAPWIALNVETPAYERLPAPEQARTAEHLALAQNMGAETLVVRGERATDEILAVARERNASHVVVGRPVGPRWRDRLHRSFVDELIRRSESIDIVVTTGEEDNSPQPRPRPSKEALPAGEYLQALAVVLGCTLIGSWTSSVFTLADSVMIYLLGVLFAASRLSRGPALFAAVASVAALDFFFVPPRFTFTVEDLRHVSTFAVMLVVALTVSSFAVRVRSQAREARQRERRTAALFTMSREFAGETEAEEIAATAVRQVRALLATDAIVLLRRSDGPLVPLAGAESPLARSDRELAVARWVLDHGRAAGHGTDTLPASHALCLPLVGTQRTLGVLVIDLAHVARPPLPVERQLLDTYAAQTAVALERAILAREAVEARIAAEGERTRSSLLSMVSHDLRTPLASITGAASVLMLERDDTDPGARRELVETLHEEADRLSRLLDDLLDLTRLESGVARIRKEWVPIEELLAAALGRLEKLLQGRDVHTHMPVEVQLVPVDPLLVEQLLINLLENAVKYSPPGSPLDIAIEVDAGAFAVEVADRGPGIRPGDEERVFERFYRAADGSRAQGAGLGLAVCSAIVRAHEGTIVARNRPGGGAVFRFRLPLEGTPPSVDPSASEPESAPR